MSRQAPGGGMFSVEAIFFRFLSIAAAMAAILVLACVAGASIPLVDTAIARSKHQGANEDPYNRADHQRTRHRGAAEKKQKPVEEAAPAAPCFHRIAWAAARFRLLERWPLCPRAHLHGNARPSDAGGNF